MAAAAAAESDTEREEGGAAGGRDLLFRLNDVQVAELGFAVGCPVAYNFRAEGGAIVAREGTVRSASMTVRKSIVYEVGRTGSGGDGEATILDTVAEDDIAYATGSPVTLKTSSNDEGKVEGAVLFAKPVHENGRASMRYIVQYVTEGNRLRMEEGVTRDRLSYNAQAAEQRSTVSEESSSDRPLSKIAPAEGGAGSSPIHTNRSREGAHHVVTPTNFDHSEGTNDGKGPEGVEEECEVHEPKLKAEELRETQAKSTQEPGPHSGNASDMEISLAHAPHSSAQQKERVNSPLAVDVSRLDDGPDQHELPGSSLKRGAPAPSNEKESKRSPRKVQRTECQPQDPQWSYYGPSRTAESSGEDKPCKLIVPLWVLDADERPSALFVHLVGHNDIPQGHKVHAKLKLGCDVRAKTGCEVHFSRYCKIERRPMTVTIFPTPYQSNEELQRNMERAVGMVEESLFAFIGERNANDRLSYELRWKSPPHAVGIPRSEGGAVRIGERRWMQLLEADAIPRESMSNSGRNVQLRKDLRKKVRDDTGCSVEAVANCPQMQLTLCRPYVVVLGSDKEQVARAVAMVTDICGDAESCESGELREDDAKGRKPSGDAEERKDYWLYRDIVVRIISKKLAGGEYYKRRAVVDKLIGKYQAEVEVLESSHKARDGGDVLRIDQDDLETVVPKKLGEKVRIVNGRHRGKKARVERLDKQKHQAELRLVEDRWMIAPVVLVGYEDFSKMA